MSTVSPQRVVGLALVPALALWCLWAPDREAPRVRRPAVSERCPAEVAPEVAPVAPVVVAESARGGTGPVLDGFLGYSRDYSPELASVFAMPSLSLALSDSAWLRPVTAPRYLPGDFSGASSVTGGVGMSFVPVSRWRFGVDLVARADQWDEYYRPEAVSTFLVPAVEYRLTPARASTLSIGILTPVSLGDSRAGNGVYFFLRWDELFGGGRRK